MKNKIEKLMNDLTDYFLETKKDWCNFFNFVVNNIRIYFDNEYVLQSVSNGYWEIVKNGKVLFGCCNCPHFYIDNKTKLKCNTKTEENIFKVNKTYTTYEIIKVLFQIYKTSRM